MKVYVTDIDNTIADARARMRRSLREIDREEVYDRTRTRFGGFDSYLDDGELDELWKVFLSDEFLHLDTPEPSASRVLNSLVDGGAKVIYLTGRHDGTGDTMRPGTEKWLRENGFPSPESEAVDLFMKPDRCVDDCEFKLGALRFLFTELSGTDDYLAELGVGDMPEDAIVYDKVGLKPVLVDWLGLFSREQLLRSAAGVRVVNSWAEIESQIL